MRHQRLPFLAVVLALLAGPVLAQKITATIRGTVTDPSGAVIAGAKVTVKNEDTGLTRVGRRPTRTGIYSFAELPVGQLPHRGRAARASSPRSGARSR